MSDARKILLVALIMILAMFLIGLLLPGKVAIAKSTAMAGPAGCPANLIGDFHQWDKWFPVLKAKLGEQQIVSDEECRIIRTGGGELNFHFLKKTADSVVLLMSSHSSEPVKMQFFILEEGNGASRLNLIVSTDLRWYPWERIKGVFLDKIMGEQYQEVVDNIASACRG